MSKIIFAEKVAAKKIGLSHEEWKQRRKDGFLWCYSCHNWKEKTCFNIDRSRRAGRTSNCRNCKSIRSRARYKPVLPENRKTLGPDPYPARSGDKSQSRHRINLEVRTGKRPRPNAIPCVDCGHIWTPGQRRHEYDHYLGYDAEHHCDVQSVCTLCHAARDSFQKNKTHCIRGHKFDEVNTGYKKNNTRFCKECRRMHDRNRKRPPGYWKAVNDRRRAKKQLDGIVHDDYPEERAHG